MAAGGIPPKSPARPGTIPGVAPAAKPLPGKPAQPTPAPAPVVAKPDGLSREEIRGIAGAIVRAETATLRDELVARLARIEERLTALEKKPATPPAPAVAPTPPPLPAPAPAPAPVAVSIPVAVSAPPPPVVVAPAPRFDLEVHGSIDDAELPFVTGARRRKRLAFILVFLLLATVGTIVITAIVSQAMNSH